MKFSKLGKALDFRSDFTFVAVCVGLVSAFVLGLVLLFPDDEHTGVLPEIPAAENGNIDAADEEEAERSRVRRGRSVRHDN